MLRDAPKNLPSYQRRLVAAGFLSRHTLAKGVVNLTGAGLDLGDLIVEKFFEVASGHWPLEVQAHSPVLTDPWAYEFSTKISENFDSFRLEGDDFLWFDTNLAHLDNLRGRLKTESGPVAVASPEGLYRPVRNPQPLVRDEFIGPSVGMHMAVPKAEEEAGWARIIDLVTRVASAVGMPLLLVERPAPEYYARRCLAALSRSAGGKWEPWMLAYRLGDTFEDYLGSPDHAVLEVGVSERIMAFTAQIQDGRFAQFGSSVAPVQVFHADPGPQLAGLRAAPPPTESAGKPWPVTRTGLAPILLESGGSYYRRLSDEYRSARPVDRPLREILAEVDNDFLNAQNRRLEEAAMDHLVPDEAGGTQLRGEGRVIRAPWLRRTGVGAADKKRGGRCHEG